MNPEDLRRAMEIFDAVCDMDEDARGPAVDAACAGDAELRAEVLRMLEFDAIDAGALRRGGAGAEWLAAEVAPESPPAPERIGGYRVVREVGRGGMGVVYEAEQGEPRRRVAVKVIREGLADPDSVQRFRREVQLLGRLQHPGIAHVYESGVDHQGGSARSYFAMEFIDGLPLDRHADERGLGIAERIELILRVCGAVHHAHQKGVMHRDLKVANVLVVGQSEDAGTGDTDSTQVDAIGQPKVMDFGIARLTEDNETNRTHVGQILGTLSSMSPEQLAGDRDSVDVRSDVYAIGVMLYRLLAGRLPHDLSGKSIPEAARIVAEDDPPTLGSVSQALRGDLSVIAQKALHRDPSQRYESVAALADDLRRVLHDEPIAARPSSTWYRARKFARRNRGLVSAGVVLLVMLVLAAGVSTGFGIWAGKSLRTAERSARDADRASYLASLSAAAAALREGDARLAGEFLDRAPLALRGWEWHHLNGLRDMSIASVGFAQVPPPNATLRAVQFAQSRSWLSTSTRRLLHVVSHRDIRPYFDAFSVPGLLPVGSWVGDRGDATLGLCGDGECVVLYNNETSTVHVRDLLTGATVSSRRLDTGGSRLAASFDLLPWSCDDATALVSGPDLLADGPRRFRFGVYSPDGRYWLSSQEPSPFAVATAGTGETRSFGPYRERAWGAAFDAAGDRLAITTVARVLDVIEFETGRSLWRVDEAHRDAIMCAAFSPDGKLLATGAQDRVIQLWDAATGALLGRLVGHEHTVVGLAFDATGETLYSHDVYGVKAWNITDAFDPGVAMRHSWFVRDIQVDSSGSLFAFTSRERVYVYDLSKKESPILLGQDQEQRVLWLCLLDNERVAVLWQPLAEEADSTDLRLTQYDAVTGHTLKSTQLDGVVAGPMRAVGDRVLIYGKEQRTAVHLATGQAETFRLDEYSLASSSPMLHASGTTLELRAGDPTGDRLWQDFELTVAAAVLHESSARVFAADAARIRVYDVRTGEMLRSVPMSDRVTSLAVLPDGSRLFSGHLDSTIRVWDGETLELVGVLRGHRDSVTSLAITPDGTTLFSGSDDYTLRRWSAGSVMFETPEENE